MNDAPFRLFNVNQCREGYDEYVKLVRDFAAHDGFRSAMVEELELDEDFYRRPLRPEDLSFISFATPVEPHDDEGIKQIEANGRDNKQVHGGNVRRVVTQKGCAIPDWVALAD